MRRPIPILLLAPGLLALGLLAPGLLAPGLLALGLLAAGPPALAAAEQRVAAAGRPLVQAGEAVRRLLWVELYRVELYLPSAQRDVRLAERADLPKAFRIEVLFDGELPEEIPDDWAAHLLPPLEEADRDRLRRAYGALSHGDELLFSYAPGRGTAMEVNGRRTLETDDHRLMAGIVELFVGPEATSEEVRRALLAGRAPDPATPSRTQAAQDR